MMGSVKALTGIFLSLLLVIIISACDSQSVAERDETEIEIDVDAEVSFATERDTYRAGDEVQIRLSNNSRSNLGYNICYTFVEMEERVNADWSSLEPGPGPNPDAVAGCTAEMRILSPDESAESIIFLPSDAAPGEYRLTHDVEINGTPYTVATSTFEVERP